MLFVGESSSNPTSISVAPRIITESAGSQSSLRPVQVPRRNAKTNEGIKDCGESEGEYSLSTSMLGWGFAMTK